MNFLWMKISEWLKELLVAGIIGNLSGLFDGINDKVAQITDVVGMTPQQWNGGVFSMVKNLSETVVTPIAGIILTAVACIELLSMMIERNNMRDFDLFEVFKWLMKTTFAVMIVSNTWTIVMGVFEATQSVVNRAAGVVVADTSIHMEEIIVNLEQRLMEMEVGPLFGLFIQSVLMQIISWLLTISIFVIVYGRMIEIYLVTSLAPVPLATMVNREWGTDRTGLFEIAVCARLSGCPDDYLRGDLRGAGAVDRCGNRCRQGNLDGGRVYGAVVFLPV